MERWPLQYWVILLAVAGLFYLLLPILTPFVVGAVIAYLGDPLVDALERRGWNRTLGVCAVFLIMTIVLALGLGLLVPMLIEQLVRLGSLLPEVVERARTTWLPWLAERLQWEQPDALLAQVGEAVGGHWKDISGIVTAVAGRVTASGMAFLGFIGTLALIPVVAFYLMRDWDIALRRVRELLPRAWVNRVVLMARECDEVLSAFLRGQLLVMLALGVIYAVGLQLIGLELGLLLGILSGLASVVPYLGFAVGIVASSIAAVMQFHDWVPLLWVLLVYVIGQLLEGTVLTPQLVGDRIGLHPVAVIFAVMAGGQLFGFVGVLLSLPVAAVIMVLLRHMHERYTRSAFYGPLDEEPQDRKPLAEESGE